MTNLPGDQIPEEALPEGGTSTPAQDAELAPVWCRHDVEWRYDGEAGGYLCTGDGHGVRDSDGEQIPAATARANEDGAVDGVQPATNAAVWDVLCAQEAAIQAEALQARVGRWVG